MTLSSVDSDGCKWLRSQRKRTSYSTSLAGVHLKKESNIIQAHYALCDLLLIIMIYWDKTPLKPTVTGIPQVKRSYKWSSWFHVTDWIKVEWSLLPEQKKIQNSIIVFAMAVDSQWANNPRSSQSVCAVTRVLLRKRTPCSVYATRKTRRSIKRWTIGKKRNR